MTEILTSAARRDVFGEEIQLRRAVLRAAQPTSVLQDDIDCADLAVASGRLDIARMLYGLVFLRVGFSSAGRAWQKRAAMRTGLWADASAWAAPTTPDTGGFSVDLAIDELAALMKLEPELARTPSEIAAMLTRERVAAPRDPYPESALASLCDRVGAILQAIPQTEADGSLAEALRGLAEDLASVPHVRLEGYVGVSIDRFAALHALNGLRQFLLETGRLLDATRPCAPLFQEAGRLNPAALGPYFSNLRLVIRNPRDIFSIIDRAAPRTLSQADIQAWVVLLSARLPAGDLLALIEELGDRGMTQALGGLLFSVSKQTPGPAWREIIWRIRDCALDIGEIALGADAQNIIALRDSMNSIEWTILGDLRGTLGDWAAAEQAFARCQLLNPHDETPRHRLDAIRSRAFDRFKISGGFTTSPSRRRLRQARVEAYRSRR
jgi:hypothetical protein